MVICLLAFDKTVFFVKNIKKIILLYFHKKAVYLPILSNDTYSCMDLSNIRKQAYFEIKFA